jgi:hypothetical protein
MVYDARMPSMGDDAPFPEDDPMWVSADELATLVRLFGDRVRIGADGVVTIEREPPATPRPEPQSPGPLAATSLQSQTPKAG